MKRSLPSIFAVVVLAAHSAAGAVNAQAAITSHHIAASPPHAAATPHQAAASRGAVHGETAHTGEQVYTPESMKWVPAPPMFPRGTRMFVMEGDPARSGPWTLRLWLPPNFRLGPYWRGTPERLTVMLGVVIIGIGDKFSDREGIAVHAGSFAMVPAHQHRTLWTRDTAVVQMHGNGPWDLIFVHVAGDPRRAAAGTHSHASR